MSKNAKRQLRAMVAAPRRPTPALSPKSLSPEERIHSMITGLLGGPGGDPDPHHQLAAAHCVLLLEQLGLRPADPQTVADLSADPFSDYMDLARRNVRL